MSELYINIVDNKYNIINNNIDNGNYINMKDSCDSNIISNIDITKYRELIEIVIDDTLESTNVDRLPIIKNNNDNCKISLILSNLDKLEILDCSEIEIKIKNKISQLEIDKCPNLKIIKNVSNIETLRIFDCDNLETITNISSIDEIHLVRCEKINDIDNISKINKFKINSCKISNICNIYEITEFLSYISFENCQIDRISNMSNIECLYVEHSYISEIDNIKNVKVLNIRDKHIDDITEQYLRFNVSIEKDLTSIMRLFLVTLIGRSSITMEVNDTNYNFIMNMSGDINMLEF